MVEHKVQWTPPSPLWLEAGADEANAQRKMRKPAILRFASDSFMEDFLQILEKDPARVTDLVARPEVWFKPLGARAAEALLEPAERTSAFARKLNRLRLSTERARNAIALRTGGGTVMNAKSSAGLKLFQPAHQRYYLVTACLVCGVVGLPDRVLDSGRQERTFFVLRRLLPPGFDQPDPNNDRMRTPLPTLDLSTWEEYAFVITSRGGAWKRVVHPGGRMDVLEPSEEPLPLFPMNYIEDDGRRRRLLVGIIPVGKREALLGAGLSQVGTQTAATTTNGGAGPLPKSDPRMIELYSKVTEPWKRAIESAWKAIEMKNTQSIPGIPTPTTDEINAFLNGFLKVTREQIQTSSWYILLDFAKFLEDRELAANLDGTLAGIVYKPGGASISLKSALAQIKTYET